MINNIHHGRVLNSELFDFDFQGFFFGANLRKMSQRHVSGPPIHQGIEVLGYERFTTPKDLDMGVSLNGGTPQTPQNDHF